ncbi:E3 ubiquitin-protein ligase RNF14-like isoform X2 [Penaeus japonicus]|uniref:E3 ubiquitin-protein ligase RNF14-like isoform X2 n=1 Tax=Penaeus japonicus TaxID=27405 RepID=UPI001C70EAB1|nr:E3 ubiquitin-protein ligase RNF14-like isoform X2 [Penaeus japonicus]
MSLDAEEQDDELLALASIYEDSFVSALDHDVEADLAVKDEVLKGGELAIHLDLPPEFTILSKRIGDDGEIHEQRLVVEHLPPLYLHFTYPSTYPSEHPPNFTLSCKWLNRAQLTQLCTQLDAQWEENKGSVIMFTWAQFLKDSSLESLSFTDELDLDLIKPIQGTNIGDGPFQENVQGETGATGDQGKVCDNSLSDNSGETEEAAVLTEARQGCCQSLDSRTIQDIAPNTNMLRLLRDYDEDMRRKVFGNKNFECKVCFMDKLGSHCLEFWPCHHVYCKDCMTSYFEIQINEGNIKFLRCPEDDCESEANPKQVQELVSEEMYKRWDEMLLNTTLSSLGDIQPCPRMHCQYPVTIEEGQGSCPSCKFVFCGLCRFGWHGIEPCKLKKSEARNALDLYVNGDDDTKGELDRRFGKKYMEMLMNEYLSLNYLEENSKQCPKCCAKIEKISGCNKMTCHRCRVDFCWLCMLYLDKERPYDHFNKMNGACYDRLFEGVDDDDEEEEELEDD